MSLSHATYVSKSMSHAQLNTGSVMHMNSTKQAYTFSVTRVLVRIERHHAERRHQADEKSPSQGRLLQVRRVELKIVFSEFEERPPAHVHISRYAH